jgi:hypothetical protein
VKGWSNAVSVVRRGGLACLVTLKDEAARMGSKGFHRQAGAGREWAPGTGPKGFYSS